MERFLASVERRALRIAEVAVGNRDDAMDLVQDAMFGLVKKYSHKPEAQWGALFYRILQNRIRDWYRRTQSSRRLFGWFSRKWDDDGDPVQQSPDTETLQPDRVVNQEQTMHRIEQLMKALPLRQQQAFLLRAWEGLSVTETAFAMRCSEGSVKTHYSRAIHRLREQLEEHQP